MLKQKCKKLSIYILALILIVTTLYFPSAAKAESNNFEKPEFIELLDQLIEAEILYGLSGAQLAVYKDGKLLKSSAYGYTNNFYNIYDENGNVILGEAKALPIEERNPVSTDTLFDLASNTKMYATVYAMQKLISEKATVPNTSEVLTLNTLISDIFPEFLDEANENGWKDNITVSHVLGHIAGFAPDPQYHNENYDEDDGIPNGKNDLYSQDKSTTFEMVMKTPLTTEPGTSWAYSDVDMMLAGFIIEEITNQNLDTYMKENFYIPLGLKRITFNPLKNGFPLNETSSAELHGNTRDGRIIFNNIRKEIVTGEVHDEKAYYSMDGISGHAGLFGTAEQIGYLAQAMLNGGELNGVKLFNQETIDQFTEASPVLSTQTVGGWRRKNASTGASGWFSVFAPEGTIGHTGWTGTNTMIDSKNNLTLSLNTNRTNSPIQGPDANTFYTTNSNISSYGTVSELIYRSLGLGTDQYTTAFSVLEKMINAEIPEGSLNEQLVSKRNVIRSLIHVLAQRAENEIESKELLNSSRIQSLIQELNETLASDVNFLVPTKYLDGAIEKAEAIDRTLYTENSINNLLDKVFEAKEVLETNQYLLTDIEKLTNEINGLINNLELITPEPSIDRSELEGAITGAEKLEETDYTSESWVLFAEALEEARNIYGDEEATQEEINAAIANLEDALSQLVMIDSEDLEAQIIQLQRRVSELEKRLNELETNNEEQLEKINTLKGLLEELQADLELGEFTLTDLELRISELEERILELEQETVEDKEPTPDPDSDGVAPSPIEPRDPNDKGDTGAQSAPEDGKAILPATGVDWKGIIYLGLIVLFSGVILFINSKRKKI